MRPTAFTIVEIIVVISLTMLLVALLLPAFTQTRESGRASICASNLRQVGWATQLYCDDWQDMYPYGVPLPIEVIDHPHNCGWLPGCARGGGVPAQQQFYDLGYIQDTAMWVCPTDPTPQNYIWWDFTNHPDFPPGVGSSYMFSEYAQYGVEWLQREQLKAIHVYKPSQFGWVTDGWECPNGWTWGVLDPTDTAAVETRIDWSHHGSVNALYGDWHVEGVEQLGIRANLRNHPLYDY
jgi:prepilin-type processing-associated H-X9-DG protein